MGQGTAQAGVVGAKVRQKAEEHAGVLHAYVCVRRKQNSVEQDQQGRGCQEGRYGPDRAALGGSGCWVELCSSSELRLHTWQNGYRPHIACQGVSWALLLGFGAQSEISGMLEKKLESVEGTILGITVVQG